MEEKKLQHESLFHSISFQDKNNKKSNIIKM